MNNNSWKYYNGALIPTSAPHEEVDTSKIVSGEIWKEFSKQKPYFARWTSNFDCKQETEWWYVIKDSPFEINKLKAKRRYEINKGLKTFDVKIVDPKEYTEEICNVQIAAFNAYSKKYRPTVNKEKFVKEINSWDSPNIRVYGAFHKETNELCGYAYLKENKGRSDFNVLKTKPKYEKYGLNAALIYKVLEDFSDKLSKGYYICDGERVISHETNFQNYLEKYFNFRKAYCELHIAYNPKFKWLIKILYPFRKLLKLFDGIGFVHKINSVLMMEGIVRRQKND